MSPKRVLVATERSIADRLTAWLAETYGMGVEFEPEISELVPIGLRGQTVTAGIIERGILEKWYHSPARAPPALPRKYQKE